MGRRDKTNKREVANALMMVLQFSINMLVPILACTFIGVYIGDRTGINWICIPLFFVGALAGFKNIYRMVKKTIGEDERNKEHDRHAKKNK